MASNQDADIVVAEFLGEQMTPVTFWERVKTNLQASRIRMLFVADQIGSELERIIEFLNQQMDPAEVLGLELRQHPDMFYQIGICSTVVLQELAIL